MFGINGIELFMVIAFALLLFGPDKIPGIAQTIGKFMREFKRTQEVMESQIRAEMYRSNLDKTEKTTPLDNAAAAEAAAGEAEDDEPEGDLEDLVDVTGEGPAQQAVPAEVFEEPPSIETDDTEDWDDEEEDEEGA